jgi:hypothetical protein
MGWEPDKAALVNNGIRIAAINTSTNENFLFG